MIEDISPHFSIFVSSSPLLKQSMSLLVMKVPTKTGAKKRVRVLQNKKGGQKWTKKESDRNMPLEKYQGGIINIQA